MTTVKAKCRGGSQRACRPRWLGALGAFAALSLVATACGTTEIGTSGAPPESAANRSPAAGASAPALVYPQENAWGDAWSLNAFSPNFVGELENTALLQLAIAEPPKLGRYIPELATSWKVSGSRVTINLRRDARWQNGKPFTSRDVLMSLELYGADGNNLWAATTGMTTPNAHTLVMSVRAGQSASLLLSDVFNVFPVPVSQYGRFIPSGFQHDLVSYYAPSGASSKTSPVGKAVSTVDTRLLKFAPKTFVGDGPYRELAITLSEMKLTSWPGVWDAKRIHVKKMDIDSVTSNEGIYPMYFSHQADFSNTAMLKAIIDRWLQTPDHGYTTMSNYGGYGIVFNNRRYPLNLTPFRQAIAYVIDRPEAALAAYGGLHLAKPDPYENGLDYSLEPAWLTQSQLKQLNAYPHDLAKAASLLDSLHFTKKTGQWFEPNGQPVKLSLTFEAGDNDAQGMASNIGAQLTNFGLKTQVTGASSTTYAANISAGTFDIGWNFVNFGGLDPLADQATTIGTSYNFPALGSYKGDAGMGFGPTMQVPGLGKVDVANTISKEASTVGAGPEMKKLTWDWAQLINKDLPYLAIADKVQQIEHSTYHYTDWPSTSSPDWTLMGLNLNGGLLVELQQGYIRPRS